MPSRPARLLQLVAATAAALVLLPGTAHAVVPTAPVRLPSGIEGFAGYQKQTTCSPTAKPGTTKLKNLLLTTYPGSRNLGIVRACSAGGTSEHKEGRAFDWGVRVNNAAEAAKANAFLTWLLKTDAAGHKAANARRLGVMYVIWNKRIWGAYSAGSGWRTYTGSNPHTDHVHISLSPTGAAAATSFWTGRVNTSGTTSTSGRATSSTPGYQPPSDPRPAPATGLVPAPRPAATLPAGAALEDEQLNVAPTRAGTVTRGALVRGQRYRVEIRGTYRWNRVAGSVADAECSTTASSRWQTTRRLVSTAGDQLGLYLDGRDLATTGFSGSTCATHSHTYVTTLAATRSGRVPLKLWEPAVAAAYGDNAGALRVRIIHDAARETLPVRLDVRDRAGTTTPGSVVAGQRYTVTVAGTWVPEAGAVADATCQDDGDGFRQPSDGRGRDWILRVDGEWLAAYCRSDHRYTWTFTAERSGPVVVRLEDEQSYADNTGGLSVTLTHVTGSDDGWDGNWGG